MKHLISLSTFLFFLGFTAICQTNDDLDSQHSYHETMDDEYMPLERRNMKRTEGRRGQNSRFFYTQVNVDDNGFNMVGDAANEPSIAVDPNNRSRMVIGWRQFDNVSSNFRQAGFAYSNDAGVTWTFPDVIDRGIFRSDPVLGVAKDGTFYYNSLTDNNQPADFSCDQFSSTSDGNWTAGTYAHGGDKQWMTVDHSNESTADNIYATWSINFSACPDQDFTLSQDKNESYPTCYRLPISLRWGTVAVDENGKLYAAGSSTFGFSVLASSDPNSIGQDSGWEVNSIVPMNGQPRLFASVSPNPQGLLGQTWIDVDRDGGDNVYVSGTFYVYENDDPCDMLFCKSSDGGLTWDQRIIINDDVPQENWQWMGVMSVAPNGRIDAVWLDTRANPNTFLSQLYYAFSTDEGETWSPNEVLVEDAFDPHVGWPNQDKMGDYFHMISDDDGADLAWAATFNGEQDVYYGRITAGVVSATNQKNEGIDFIIQPNPSNGLTTFTIPTIKSGEHSIQIRNMAGQVVDVVAFNKNEIQRNRIQINLDHLNGLYICEYYMDASLQSMQKLLVIE